MYYCAMDAFEMDAAVHAARKESDAARKAYEEFMVPITPEMTRLSNEIRVAAEAARMKLTELFAATVYEDLLDELKAAVVYEIAWNKGNPISHIDEKAGELFPDTYVRAYTAFYGRSDRAFDADSMLSFIVALPPEKDEEKLKRTADLLEPVLRVQAKISEAARLDVFEDGYSSRGSYSIVWDEEQKLWALHRGSYEEFSSAKLIEVLKRAPVLTER